MRPYLRTAWISLSFIACLSCRSTSESQVREDDEEILKPWTKIASKEFKMAPPPAPGAASKADFDELLKLQKARDPKDCEIAKKQRFPTFAAFFKDQPELLSDEEFERVKELMEKVTKFSERVAGFHKDKFERERPFNVDAKIKPCVTKPTGSKAYPSSHAAVAATEACVLAEIFPERADEINKHGERMGNLRAIVGVHHPSDVKAGQKLARDICDRLFTEPTFNDDIAGFLPNTD